MGDEFWSKTRLRDHIDYFKGFAFKSQDYITVGHPIIRVSNFTDRSLDLSGCNFISPTEASKYPDYEIRTDDVIIATVGSWPANPESVVGKTIKVPKEADGALLNQNTLCLRAVSQLDQVFMFYLLKDKDFQNYLIGGARGSANQASITIQSVFDYTFACPPLPEQRAIAGILGALDDKIELNRRMNRTLESMARAIFRQWFVENEEVTGWKVGKLSEICTTQYGFTASASNEPVGPKFLRITDMNKEPWIIWADVPYCEISEIEFKKYKLGLGNILVSRMADPGKAGIVEEEVNAVFASYLVRLKFVDLAWSYFAYYFLRSEQYLEYANGAKSGSVQSGMNARVIADVNLSIPPNERVVAFYEIIKPLRHKIVANLKESRTLGSLRDSLLPKLMRGEVRVRGT